MRTLRSPYGASRPSVVCRLRRSCDVLSGLNFWAIFLQHLIAKGIGQFVLKFWATILGGSMGSWQ